MKTRDGQRIFSIPTGEKILVVAVVLNLSILAYAMLSSARYSIDDSQLFSSTQSTYTGVTYTERETLAFTVTFSQWLGGQVPKREVQIRQGLLAQRLAVINNDGTSTGERAYPQFLNQLKATDVILSKAPDGILPPVLRQELADEASSLIDDLVFSSRQILSSYQRELDAIILKSTESRSQSTLTSLLALISFIALSSILVIWVTRSFRRQYKVARQALRDEELALKLAESKLRESEIMVRKLEEMDIAKSDFISTVNHELRTPLTSIIGYIDVLKTLDIENDADQLPQITTVIDRNSEVLLDIIESILSLSSLDSYAQKPRFERTGLIEIIDRKIFVLTPLINNKALLVNFHHDFVDDFEILGNAGQISQVVLNLLSNAIKFSPEGSEIDIYLSVVSKIDSPDIIKLEIKDHGIGIPKEEIQNLFTRFFRASNAVSSQITGTGLGLAIVARILVLHQAIIRVESVVNQGSSFIVEFPRFVSEAEQHVLKNRSAVLFKAIVALKAGGPDDLIEICHQMSGTLGFYDLESEMHKISDFQLWLESNPSDLDELLDSKKEELVKALETSYSALDDGMDRKS